MTWFRSEREVARVVVEWLQAQEWDVYQEVSTGAWTGRADIVAMQGVLSWIIEAKRTLSLDLMAQAFDWTGRANFVSVAVPLTQNSRGRTFAKHVLRERGIGVIECDPAIGVWHDPPRLTRRIIRPIRELLCDEHKMMAEAGSAGGGYATPFAITCRGVGQFVATNPGCTIRELVAGIDHHYLSDSTARSCLNRWIGTHKIPDVERRREGRDYRLFPSASEAAKE